MRREEFESVFKNFNDSYRQAYPPNQINRIWEYVQYLLPGEFEFKLAELEEANVKAPPIGHIRAHFRDMVNKIRSERATELVNRERDCKACSKTGMVSCVSIAKDDTYGYWFTFRCTQCNCASILNLSMQIPPWKNSDDFILQDKYLGHEFSDVLITPSKILKGEKNDQVNGPLATQGPKRDEWSSWKLNSEDF